MKFYLPLSFHIRMIMGVMFSSNIWKFFFASLVLTGAIVFAHILAEKKEEMYWTEERGGYSYLMDR